MSVFLTKPRVFVYKSSALFWSLTKTLVSLIFMMLAGVGGALNILNQDHSRISHFPGRGFCESYTNLFSRSSFCLNQFSGLFFRDGRVIGFFRVFSSLCIPLGISVE